MQPEPWREKTELEYKRRFPKRLEDWLDQGMGECLLKDHKARAEMVSVLRHFDRVRYELVSFVIMPNHLHVLVRLKEWKLETLVRAWKSYSARRINDLRMSKGAVWQQEYWDTLIRDTAHLYRVLRYIGNNPLKARLGEEDYTHWCASLDVQT
jgi:putative transposase